MHTIKSLFAPISGGGILLFKLWSPIQPNSHANSPTSKISHNPADC